MIYNMDMSSSPDRSEEIGVPGYSNKTPSLGTVMDSHLMDARQLGDVAYVAYVASSEPESLSLYHVLIPGVTPENVLGSMWRKYLVESTAREANEILSPAQVSVKIIPSEEFDSLRMEWAAQSSNVTAIIRSVPQYRFLRR